MFRWSVKECWTLKEIMISVQNQQPAASETESNNPSVWERKGWRDVTNKKKISMQIEIHLTKSKSVLHSVIPFITFMHIVAILLHFALVFPSPIFFSFFYITKLCRYHIIYQLFFYLWYRPMARHDDLHKHMHVLCIFEHNNGILQYWHSALHFNNGFPRFFGNPIL